MSRRRRVVFGTLCVEGVAAIAVLTQGVFSLVAVAILYWFDLMFVVVRTMARQLIEGETTVPQVPRGLVPCRLLRDKRGRLRLSDRLPPVSLQSLPAVSFSASVLVFSVLTTTPVLLVSVPDGFWSDPATPFVLAGGGVAAAAKSWLLFRAHVDREGVENERGAGAVAGKRHLLVLSYAGVLFVVSSFTTSALTDPETGITAVRNTMLSFASVAVIARLVYGIRASNPSSDSGKLLARLGSVLPTGDSSGSGRPSTPDGGSLGTTDPDATATLDGQSSGTVEPAAASVRAAGVVNALAAGGVVDGQFSHVGLRLRATLLLVLIPGTLAAVTGSLAFVVFVLAVGFSVLVFSLASVAHLQLALGAMEYRFSDAAIVAYDKRLEEPQWAVRYDDIETVSVERGPFGSPLWFDTGTVALELTDDRTPDRREQFSLSFVPDPERIGDRVRARCPATHDTPIRSGRH
jgi:hypothetical protein